MRSKKMALLLGLCMAVGMMAGCGRSPQSEQAGTLEVSVTFNALQEFVKAVGQDKVTVTTIIPDGVEPHDFEPKAQDLVKLGGAKVFVYNGLGMEPWAEDAVAAANNPGLILVQASAGGDWLQNTDSESIQEHGPYDPHFWLSLKGAEVEVQNICAALIQADPDNQAFYEQNRDAYIAQLTSLYDEYKSKFASLSKKNFVTGHAAFGYLCREFGLVQNSVEDVFAEGEPSAQQLSKLVEYCKQNQVTTIFSEAMASADVSRTLANEVNAKVEPIYTMESNEDNKSYLARMQDNLMKIYQSLTE